MMKDNLKKHVITALFAALTFAATMAVRIPTPGTNGYIHPGDALVILSGVILGPSNGFLAAGIGSALADLLGGYFVYVPITFLIKGIVALSCGLIFQKAGKHPCLRCPAVAAGGIVDILLSVQLVKFRCVIIKKKTNLNVIIVIMKLFLIMNVLNAMNMTFYILEVVHKR